MVMIDETAQLVGLVVDGGDQLVENGQRRRHDTDGNLTTTSSQGVLIGALQHLAQV